MITTTNLLQVPLGELFLIVRPDTLATDWRWEIRERDDSTVLKDTATGFITNATRHTLLELGDHYETNVVYELRILDVSLAVVASGYFQVYRGVVGPLSAIDFTGVNAQLRIVAGLVGLNSQWSFTTYDAVTGYPTSGELTIYADEARTAILAKYQMRRRLNSVKMTAGEIMWQTYYDPSVLQGGSV